MSLARRQERVTESRYATLLGFLSLLLVRETDASVPVFLDRPHGIQRAVRQCFYVLAVPAILRAHSGLLRRPPKQHRMRSADRPARQIVQARAIRPAVALLQHPIVSLPVTKETRSSMMRAMRVPLAIQTPPRWGARPLLVQQSECLITSLPTIGTPPPLLTHRPHRAAHRATLHGYPVR
jgi:hypothetical protein